MAEGNVYSNFLDMFKEEGYNKDTSIKVGKVISVSPLKVDMGGYTIDESDMYLCDSVSYLKNNGIGKTTVTHNYGKETVTTVPISPLKIGDRLVVIVQNSSFYVIDRAVSK